MNFFKGIFKYVLACLPYETASKEIILLTLKLRILWNKNLQMTQFAKLKMPYKKQKLKMFYRKAAEKYRDLTLKLMPLSTTN